MVAAKLRCGKRPVGPRLVDREDGSLCRNANTPAGSAEAPRPGQGGARKWLGIVGGIVRPRVRTVPNRHTDALMDPRAAIPVALPIPNLDRRQHGVRRMDRG